MAIAFIDCAYYDTNKQLIKTYVFKCNYLPPEMPDNIETHWETIQAKTFTKWINDKLVKGGHNPIKNIYKDFRDGVSLGNLLTTLLNIEISYNKKPFTRIQKVENLEVLLKQIKKRGLSLINIGPEDIVDGNRKLILGLIWTLISKLAISELGSGDLSVKSELLRWCQEVTEAYSNVNVIDLTRSWQDGLAFNALIHHYRPDLVNYNELTSKDRHYNLQQAFDIAERELKIPKFLDVEDVADVVRPDEKIMITYLSEYYKKFNKFEKERICKNILKNVVSKIEWSIQGRNFYEIMCRSYLNKQKMIEEKTQRLFALLNELQAITKDIQDMNSDILNNYVSIYSTYSEIKEIHKLYNLKEYTPPAEISIDKITYNYCDPMSTILHKVGIKAEGDMCSVDHREPTEKKSIQNKDEVNCQCNKLQSVICALSELCNTNVTIREKIGSLKKYQSSTSDILIKENIKRADMNNICSTTKRHIDFLTSLNNESSKNDEILEKAKRVFDRNNLKQISVQDFIDLSTKLGLLVDDDIINDIYTNGGNIDRDTFLESIRVLLANEYDSVCIQRALKGLGTIKYEIDENNHKNLLNYNGKNKTIDFEKLLNEFIKQ